MPDSSHRWNDILEALGRQPPSPYRYPDRANAMEDGVFDFSKHAMEAALISDCLEALPPCAGFALDAGCGRGAHTRPLARRFSRVLALDADAQRLASAARLCEDDERVRCFPVRLDDPLLGTPAFAGAFALVQCMQVLGHVPAEAASGILQTFRSMLEPAGSLLLAVPLSIRDEDEYWVAELDGANIGGRRSARDEFEALATDPRPGLLPVRHFSMHSLVPMLYDAGFAIRLDRRFNWLDETRGDVLLVAARS